MKSKISCTDCSDEGTLTGCGLCGKVKFDIATKESITTVEGNFIIPTYYKTHTWLSDKIKSSENSGTTVVLEVLNNMILQTAKGQALNASYAILLPDGSGKRTAMYSLITNYLESGKTVAPVVDLITLALLEGQSKITHKEVSDTWNKITTLDLVCVYGVDLNLRYTTMRLFSALCSIRALKNKPTLLFASDFIDRLVPYGKENMFSEENNNKDIGCRLSHPYILDGVRERRKKK